MEEQEKNNSGKRGVPLSVKVIIIISAILLLIFVFLGTIVSRRISRGIEETQIYNIMRSGRALTENMELTLDFHAKIVEIAASDSRLADALQANTPASLFPLLNQVLNSSTYFRGTAIIDSSGEFTNSLSRGETEGIKGSSAFFRGIADGSEEERVQIVKNKPGTPSVRLILAEPIRKNGKTAAIFAAEFDLLAFEKDYILNKTFGKEGYPFVMDDTGLVLGHPGEAQLNGNFGNEPFAEAMFSSKWNEGSVWYSWEGRKKLLTFQRMESTGWYVAASIYQTDLMELSGTVIGLIIFISGAALLVTIGLVYIAMRFLFITRIKKLAEDINAASAGDLTVEIKTKFNDELSFLGNRFARLLTNFKTLLADVKERMGNLNDTGIELSTNTQETAASVNQINANIESTKNQMENQSAGVSQTSATIEEMTQNINSLNNAIDAQAASVTQSSSAIEEMIANVRSITRLTERGDESVQTLINSSERGKTKIAAITERVMNISQRSETLMEANNLIANIASQTNLLSMNAAIEAAHAGESGRGFAVVADEIRKLAELSTEQSKSVRQNIMEIRGTIEESVSMSQDTSAAFEQVMEIVGTVNNLFKEIKESMMEQSSGSQQVLNALESMKDITMEVQSGSKEMTEANQQILEATTNLNGITRQIKSAIEEIAAGTNEINAAVSNISDLSRKNKEDIEEVIQSASAFTVEDL